MTTEEACEVLVRDVETTGAESFEKNFIKDGKIVCSVFVFVGPHAQEMNEMIRKQLSHYGFMSHPE